MNTQRMTPYRIRKFIACIACIPIGAFALIVLFSFFGIVPPHFAVQALASLCAVVIGSGILYLAFVAGYEIVEATTPGHFSLLRLAMGLAIAFALVSFFEIYL